MNSPARRPATQGRSDHRDGLLYLEAGAVAARGRHAGRAGRGDGRALAEAFTGEIAEKRDIEALRRDVETAETTAKRNLDSAADKLGARLTFLQWQLGLITALVLGVLFKLFLR